MKNELLFASLLSLIFLNYFQITDTFRFHRTNECSWDLMNLARSNKSRTLPDQLYQDLRFPIPVH